MLLPLAPTSLTRTLPLGYLYVHYIQESSYTRELSGLRCLNICDWGNKVLGKYSPSLPSSLFCYCRAGPVYFLSYSLLE